MPGSFPADPIQKGKALGTRLSTYYHGSGAHHWDPAWIEDRKVSLVEQLVLDQVWVQPRSQGLSSSRPLERKKRDPGNEVGLGKGMPLRVEKRIPVKDIMTKT